MNAHKTGIRQGSTEEYTHFRCDEDHLSVPVHERFKIQVAEKIFEDDGVSKARMKTRRLQREFAWMCRLQTVFLFGLNTRVKGLGIVNDSSRCKDFNLYQLSSSCDKKIRQHKHKSKVNRTHIYGDADSIRNFVDGLSNLDNFQCLLTVRRQNIRFLKKCSCTETFSNLTITKQKIVTDWIAYVCKPKNKVNRKEKRLYFEVNFLHRGIQRLNLRKILNEINTVRSIPKKSKFKALPIIYYKYVKNIGLTILNYNKATRESTFRTFQDVENMS